MEQDRSHGGPPPEPSKEFANFLQNLNQRQGRPIREISKITGLWHSQIAAYFRGQRLPRDETSTKALVESLGGGPDDLRKALELLAIARGQGGGTGGSMNQDRSRGGMPPGARILLVEFFQDLERRYGRRSFREISKKLTGMSDSRIRGYLEGGLYPDEETAEALVVALGGDRDDVRHALELLASARHRRLDHSPTEPRKPPLRRVFVSYVREDWETVDGIAEALRAQHIDVWLDRTHLRPGDRWATVIREAIRHGDYFIACFSRAYSRRVQTYMNEELLIAIEELRQRPRERRWFLPVLLEGGELPDHPIGAGETLRSFQHVDFSKGWAGAIAQLKHVIDNIVHDMPTTQTYM